MNYSKIYRESRPRNLDSYKIINNIIANLKRITITVSLDNMELRVDLRSKLERRKKENQKINNFVAELMKYYADPNNVRRDVWDSVGITLCSLVEAY